MKVLFPFFIIFFSFFLSKVHSVETDKSNVSQIQEIKEKIVTLEQGLSFAYIDLGLTETDLTLIDKLNFDKLGLDTTKQYDRFGNLHLLKDELSLFLKEIGNNDELVVNAVSEIISRIAYDITKGSNKETAWVCVRASTPNHKFDMPRWHTDGQYYGFNQPKESPEMLFKFGAALKGRPTLLYNLPSEMRDLFNLHSEDRLYLNDLLDVNTAESPQKGQGVLFIVADNEKAAVHSEPKMDENRLFFSVLVGDESEINELNSRWSNTKKEKFNVNENLDLN